MQAFIRQEDCILLREDWQGISLEAAGRPDSVMVDRLLQVFTHIPSLGRLVRRTSANSPQSTIDQVIRYGKDLWQKFDSIWAEAEQMGFSGSDSPLSMISTYGQNEPFSSTLTFRSLDHALFCTWFWAAKLIINVYTTNLLASHYTETEWQINKVSTRLAAQNICASCEFAATLKPLGAQFIQLPLICAYSVSNEGTREWILNEINMLVADLHVQYVRQYLDHVSAAILGNVNESLLVPELDVDSGLGSRSSNSWRALVVQ